MVLGVLRHADGRFAETAMSEEAHMCSTSAIFPCDLNEPILIPADEDLEPVNESIDYSAFGTASVRSQDQEAVEWSDIT